MTAWSGSSLPRQTFTRQKVPERRRGTWCLRDSTLSLSLPSSRREEAAGVTALSTLLEAGQTLDVRQLPPHPKLHYEHGELDKLPGDP